MIYLLFCAIIATAIEHLRYGFCIEHLRYGFCCAWNVEIDNFRFAAIFQVKIPFQDGAAPLLNRELHLPLNRSFPPLHDFYQNYEGFLCPKTA